MQESHEMEGRMKWIVWPYGLMIKIMKHVLNQTQGQIRIFRLPSSLLLFAF